jgi:hypothetical protein
MEEGEGKEVKERRRREKAKKLKRQGVERRHAKKA